MAGEDRRPPPDLKRELLDEGGNFSFFQAIRLLRFIIGRETEKGAKREPLANAVRIRPKLSLAHPSREIDRIDIESEDPPRYELTANFLGLYGESSPLPAFYTEDLMDESPEGESAIRRFFDIINFPIYQLFYQCWTKYRPFLKVVDEEDENYLEMMYSLMGMSAPNIRDNIFYPMQLLKYVGLLSLSPKSALGLKRLLADALDEPRVEIIPCIRRMVQIPEEQRCYLGQRGNRLGEECYLGEVMGDRTRKFRIRIGPVKARNFRYLLPGTAKYRKIIFMSDIYLTDPYERDLAVAIEPGEVETARLGDLYWSQLGIDTWLFSGEYDRQVEAVFELKQ